MRELIIKSLDTLVWVIAGLTALAGLIAGILALGNGQPEGLAFIVGGFLYAVVFAGSFFILIGVYNNTKRTADAIEKMAQR